MGCGMSKSSVKPAISTKEANATETNMAVDEVQSKKSLLTTSDNAALGRTYSAESENLFEKSLVGNNKPMYGQIIQSPPMNRLKGFVKTPGNMDLQERIYILSERRKSLQSEIGENSLQEDTDALSDDSSSKLNENGSPQKKSIFSLPPEPNGYSSPFVQRPRITLTDSQKDFFLMLDEKIAQGKDYYSEDEQSISSLVSRTNESGKLTKILATLRAQRTR